MCFLHIKNNAEMKKQEENQKRRAKKKKKKLSAGKLVDPKVPNT